jgi:hypothetical protein
MMVEIGIDIDPIRQKFDRDFDFDIDIDFDFDFDLESIKRCCSATARLIRDDTGRSRSPSCDHRFRRHVADVVRLAQRTDHAVA